MKSKIALIICFVLLQLFITSCEKSAVTNTVASQLQGNTWVRLPKADTSAIQLKDSLGNIIGYTHFANYILRFEGTQYTEIDTPHLPYGAWMGFWSVEESKKQLTLKSNSTTIPKQTIWNITNINDVNLEMYRDDDTLAKRYVFVKEK